MNHSKGWLPGMFAALCLLAGCGGQEVNRRAMVTALELKPMAEGWQVTAEYLEHTSADEPQKYGICQGQGKTWLEALGGMESEIGRVLCLDSVKCLILTEVKERAKLEQILLEAEQDGHLRPYVQVVAGEDVLASGKEETVSIGRQVQELMEGPWEGYGVTLKDAVNMVCVTGRSGMFPGIQQKDGECHVTEFYLTAPEGLQALDYEVGTGLPLRLLRKEEFVFTQDGKPPVDLQLENTRLRIRCSFSAGRPVYTMEASAKGYLRMMPPQNGGDRSGQLEEMETRMEEEIKRETVFLMENIVKQTGTDLFSMGKICSLWYPEQWENLKNNWTEILKNVEYRVTAQVEIQDRRRLLEK